MSPRDRKLARSRRAGAATVECAVVLPVALLILFSLLNLGLATIRYNVLAEAARRVAREAITHGSLVPHVRGAWGPDPFAGTAADPSPLIASLQNLLPTMVPDEVGVSVTWLDGDNTPHSRVEVALSYKHQSLIPFLASWKSIDLHAETLMRIVN